MIRIVKNADAARIAEIYNHYILNTLITFEEQPVTPEEILARIKSITTEYPWQVYEEDGRVVGYAYATRWKERSAYRRTVEAAIYLDVQVTGRHVGSQLTAALLEALHVMRFTACLLGSLCRTPPVWGCARNLGSRRSDSSRKSDISTINGWTLDTGN